MADTKGQKSTELAKIPSEKEAMAAFAPIDEAGNRITVAELFKQGYETEVFIPLNEVKEFKGTLIGPAAPVERVNPKSGEVTSIPMWSFSSDRVPGVTAIIVGSYKINQRLKAAKKGDEVMIVRLGKKQIGDKQVNDDMVMVRRNGEDVIDTVAAKV